MLNNRGEKKFKKQFPDLKQVINGKEIEFEMYGQVPLRTGVNSVYLQEPSGRKTTYTEFEVDNMHKYGLRVELNYAYIMEKLKSKILKSIIAAIIVAVAILIFLNSLGFIAVIISILALFIIYSVSVNKLVKGLGISAYRVVVVTEPVH